jgi:hypothetical protein
VAVVVVEVAEVAVVVVVAAAEALAVAPNEQISSPEENCFFGPSVISH